MEAGDRALLPTVRRCVSAELLSSGWALGVCCVCPRGQSVTFHVERETKLAEGSEFFFQPLPFAASLARFRSALRAALASPSSRSRSRRFFLSPPEAGAFFAEGGVAAAAAADSPPPFTRTRVARPATGTAAPPSPKTCTPAEVEGASEKRAYVWPDDE